MLFIWAFYSKNLDKNITNIQQDNRFLNCHMIWFAAQETLANQYIRMISEESRDTEDWSNDSITIINYILKYINIESRYLKYYISQSYCFCCKINASSVSINDLI